MTQADAFLQDILARPDDDAPRLIFADWLEEQGDTASVARAEFIRVQCALAGGDLPEQRRSELNQRQHAIFEQYRHEWEHPIRRLVRAYQYHRGFIDEVTVWADSFLKHVDRLFRRAPIQHLTLCSRGSEPPVGGPLYMAELADSEHLCRLRSLRLRRTGLESRHLRALLVSEHLTSLTELDLALNRIGDSGIRALAKSPLLGRLERLNLWGNDVGAGGLRVLLDALDRLDRAPDGLRLQRLELSHDNLSAAGQRVIADSPLLRRVVRW